MDVSSPSWPRPLEAALNQDILSPGQTGFTPVTYGYTYRVLLGVDLHSGFGSAKRDIWNRGQRSQTAELDGFQVT